MIVEKRRIGDDVVLSVEGVIKMGESAQFLAQTLERLLAEPGRHVFVDLERINAIDSTGIGELVGYFGRFRDSERRLVLVHPPERIRRLLAIAQLDELLPTYATLDAALAGETG